MRDLLVLADVQELSEGSDSSLHRKNRFRLKTISLLVSWVISKQSRMPAGKAPGDHTKSIAGVARAQYSHIDSCSGSLRYSAKLKLQHVHGYNGNDLRGNLVTVSPGVVAYCAAGACVLHAIDTGEQRPLLPGKGVDILGGGRGIA